MISLSLPDRRVARSPAGNRRWSPPAGAARAMFDRVYPRVRLRDAIVSGHLVASLATHAVLLGTAGLVVPRHVAEPVMESIQYFAPVPERRPEMAGERLSFLNIAGAGVPGRALGSLETLGDGSGLTPRGREGPDSSDGGVTLGVASVPDFPAIDLDSVYFPEEVDNPAAYDPRSRAPAYPDSLQRLGIEGWVTAQFIVDTTGHPADSTLRILDFTHQPFVQSVRDALPGMIFRPAEIRGAKIRQLVQQTFSFRMSSPVADSTRRSPVPIPTRPPSQPPR